MSLGHRLALEKMVTKKKTRKRRKVEKITLVFTCDIGKISMFFFAWFETSTK